MSTSSASARLADLAKPIPLLSGVREIATAFDLAICDLWGVMHDGITAHPEAIEAITQLRAVGVQTVFLSNAPRPRTHVRQHLIDMGVPRSLTDFIVTSGGLARDAVRANWTGKKLYHLGPDEDQNTIDGLDIIEVDHPNDANVILATGLDFADPERHRNWLEGAAKNKTPFLCANPDRIVHVGEKLYWCAGAIADIYTEMGGPVTWFGKPTAHALTACIKECGMPPPDQNRIVMIGDSLQTDIAGARSAGYQGLLVAAGIHRADWPEITATADEGSIAPQRLKGIFGENKPLPDMIIKQLRW